MLINPKYKAFKEDYNEHLFGKHLTGRDDIWHSLYFTNRKLYDKYKYRIPETYAMGDVLGIAYKVLR